jgi:hypothetical protein
MSRTTASGGPFPGPGARLRELARRYTASMRFSGACQEQANVRTDIAQACVRTVVQASDNHALSRQFKSTGHARADQIGSHDSAVQLNGRSERTTRVELELLTPVVVPAIMPLSWGFRCALVLNVWRC